MRRSAVTVGLPMMWAIVLMGFACSHQDGPAALGGAYLGQEQPGVAPELFAPGVITTAFHEHSSPAFSPDGNEVYWSVFLNFWGPQVILTMRMENGRWTQPEVASFSGQYSDGNPAFSHDGRRLLFESRRPVAADAPYTGETDLWVVDRMDVGWGEPRHLGWTVNSARWDRGPCTSANGNLYFSSERDGGYGRSDIYRAEWVNGAYATPTNLGSMINTEGQESFPYIAPDESFIIYESASGDLLLHFRHPDDGWSEAINMAGKLKSSGPQDRFPRLSNDGAYLFFVSNRWLGNPYPDSRMGLKELKERAREISNGMGNVFWVDARIIEDLKQEELRYSVP
jgi:Tol biopolymer transport system component